jgi:hypothetical protein
MSRYIGWYTSTCDLCLRTKVLRQPPVGHLDPTPIPNRRWHTVSVDFIVDLPQSNGYDSVMVVVDLLSKRSHFIPMNTTISAVGAARLFRDHVWKLHGLPTRIIVRATAEMRWEGVGTTPNHTGKLQGVQSEYIAST